MLVFIIRTLGGHTCERQWSEDKRSQFIPPTTWVIDWAQAWWETASPIETSHLPPTFSFSWHYTHSWSSMRCFNTFSFFNRLFFVLLLKQGLWGQKRPQITLLPQIPYYWDYWQIPPCPVNLIFLLNSRKPTSLTYITTPELFLLSYLLVPSPCY